MVCLRLLIVPVWRTIVSDIRKCLNESTKKKKQFAGLRSIYVDNIIILSCLSWRVRLGIYFIVLVWNLFDYEDDIV